MIRFTNKKWIHLKIWIFYNKFYLTRFANNWPNGTLKWALKLQNRLNFFIPLHACKEKSPFWLVLIRDTQWVPRSSYPNGKAIGRDHYFFDWGTHGALKIGILNSFAYVLHKQKNQWQILRNSEWQKFSECQFLMPHGYQSQKIKVLSDCLSMRVRPPRD